MKYDLLIVGAGLYGAVFACEATKHGKKCLVIDRRDHIAGNIYTQNVCGIDVHKYGAHIFHTSDKAVWDYICSFAEFNNYVNCPVARYNDELYNLPFNMNTFCKLWNDVITPSDAKRRIADEVAAEGIVNPCNLEEQALSLVGRTIYEKLIKGYTEKQWGRKCSELPAFIIKRLPLRFTFDNNYFNDKFQGIPVGGYTQIVEKMLVGCEVLLQTDYKQFVAEHPGVADVTVYTGSADELFDYKLGNLQYRSVSFQTELLQTDNYQGNAVVNYTSANVPYTRIIEHKHFVGADLPATVISKEFPCEWSQGIEPYYPVNDERNNNLYAKYAQMAQSRSDLILGGRLGNYTYYDMDKVVAKALQDIANYLDNCKKA